MTSNTIQDKFCQAHFQKRSYRSGTSFLNLEQQHRQIKGSSDFQPHLLLRTDWECFWLDCCEIEGTLLSKDVSYSLPSRSRLGSLRLGPYQRVGSTDPLTR